MKSPTPSFVVEIKRNRRSALQPSLRKATLAQSELNTPNLVKPDLGAAPAETLARPRVLQTCAQATFLLRARYGRIRTDIFCRFADCYRLPRSMS